MKKLALIAFTANSTKVSVTLQGRRSYDEGPQLKELIGDNPVICEDVVYESLLRTKSAPDAKIVILCKDLITDPDEDAIVCRNIWAALEHTDTASEKGDTVFFLCKSDYVLAQILERLKFPLVYTVHSIEPNAKTHKCVY